MVAVIEVAIGADSEADSEADLAVEIAVGHPEGLVDLAVEVSVVVVPAAIGRNKKRLAKPTFFFLYYFKCLDVLDNHCGSSSSSVTNACASNLTVVLFQYMK